VVLAQSIPARLFGSSVRASSPRVVFMPIVDGVRLFFSIHEADFDQRIDERAFFALPVGG